VLSIVLFAVSMPEPTLTPEQRAPRAAEEELANDKRDADLATDREAAQARQKQNLDRLMTSLSSAGIDNSIIESFSVQGDTVTMTVSNVWHLTAYQIRLQAAQNLWKLWASIASPAEPDKARIKLVDFNGNEVGGSRVLAGSLIWVQEN
jgi:hypothetical protein